MSHGYPYMQSCLHISWYHSFLRNTFFPKTKLHILYRAVKSTPISKTAYSLTKFKMKALTFSSSLPLMMIVDSSMVNTVQVLVHVIYDYLPSRSLCLLIYSWKELLLMIVY